LLRLAVGAFIKAGGAGETMAVVTFLLDENLHNVV